jgi:hypothetical protein
VLALPKGVIARANSGNLGLHIRSWLAGVAEHVVDDV